MKEYISNFDKGDKRQDNVEYHRLSRKIAKLNYKLETVKDEAQKAERIKKVKEIEGERKLLPCGNEMDKGYRRLKYVRYADDFLIGVIGSKEECEIIKKELTTFLSEKLKLTLSKEKPLITHANKSDKFIG